MTGSKEQKTTHLFPSKYAKTYIHREHAILHTLEIERSQLSENNHEHSSLIYISDTEQPDAEFENMFDKLSELESFSVSPPEHRPYILVNDSEDDRSKKHMRGLKDIGTGGELKPCVKRRRSQVAYGHDCVKKRNRSYQPTNALKRTETVMEPDTREIYRNLSGVSGVEYNDAKQSLSNSSGDSCVWLFDVPYTGCEPNLTAGLVTVNETDQAVRGPQSGQSSLVETVSGGPDEIQEFGSISSGNGTSEWQHRGKKILRVNTKNAQKVLYPEVKFKSDPIMDTVTAPQKLIPYCQSRFTVNPKYQSCVSYTDNDTISLYDVDIEVQAAQLPQDAPYISLMSKSSRHRTTGHALLVEVLDDSESDLSLIGSESISSSYELNGVDSKKLEIQNLSSITCLKNPNEASKVVKLGRGKHLRDKTRKRKALTGLERQNESGQHDDISTGLERQSESGQQDDISTYSSITHANPSLSSHEQEHLIKCPRCNSSNTKFVYYNNYNLSQPRHYCKRCRRFWTIGGALRNLRVGGGFRKTSKHASKSKRGVSSSANSDFIKTKFRRL